MFADVAQQVEHFLGKEEASSSNLPISSITPQTCSVVFLFVVNYTFKCNTPNRKTVHINLWYNCVVTMIFIYLQAKKIVL